MYIYTQSFIVNSLYKGPPAGKINLLINNKMNTIKDTKVNSLHDVSA